MPVSPTFYQMSMKELAEVQAKRSSLSIVPEYQKRLFRQGYDAFFDDKIIKDCPYSSITPPYGIWVKGWVEGFRQLLASSQESSKESSDGKPNT